MAPRRDVLTLVKVATMYYAEGQNQSAIAKSLGISTSSISRILAQARDDGLVTVIIRDPSKAVERRTDLENALVKEFGLRRAWVAAIGPGSRSLDEVGRLAAEVFAEYTAQVRSVGLSWGRTVRAFVQSVPDQPTSLPLELYPLSGGMSDQDANLSGNAVVQELAGRCGGHAHRIDAPAIVQSARTGKAMLDEPVVARALEAAQDCDLAIVGVGSMGVHWSAGLVRSMRLDPEQLEQVRAAGIAGDVCGRFINDDGKPVLTPADDHVIGLTFEQLSHIERVMGIVSGAEKSRGAAAVLRSGILTGIVLDENLAEVVLSAS